LHNDESTPRRSLKEKEYTLDEEKSIKLFSKYGLKVKDRFRLIISSEKGNLALQKVLKFFNRNRLRMSSLKALTAKIDVRSVIPLLMTRVPIRSMIQKLGKKLRELRNLQQVQIGWSQVESLSIEETLIDSLSRLKKIRALSIELADDVNKINFISKKLATFKGLNRLELNFAIQRSNILPIFKSIKACSRLKILKIDLSDCKVSSDLLNRMSETIIKLRSLEYLLIDLNNTEVTTEDITVLKEKIAKHQKIQYFKVYIYGCPNVSMLMKLQLYMQENWNNMSKLC